MSNTDQISLTLDQLGRIARELQYSNSLNPAQWEALRYIARANKFSRTPGALADFLGATKGTVSQTVIALENKGLVTRKRCDKDGRIMRLQLTEAGQVLATEDPLIVINEYCDRLPDKESALLLQSLQSILHIMRIKSRSEEFGFCIKCQSFIPCQSSKSGEPDICNFQKEPLYDQDLNQICSNFSAQPD
jgi:DNA-binding MarR family transcriptional regulator